MRAIRSHCRQFKTISFDNGTEFHDYALLEERFPVKVYFATLPLVGTRQQREFQWAAAAVPTQGMCMRSVTQAQCNQISEDLNNRHRKRFGFKTPVKLYYRN